MGPESARHTEHGLHPPSIHHDGSQHDRRAVPRRVRQLELEFEQLDSSGALDSAAPSRSTTCSCSRPATAPADLAGMTAAFEKANPNIKINNTLVALRGAARQDRRRRSGRNVRRRSRRRDLAGRVRLEGDRRGHHRQGQHAADEPDLPGRARDGQLQEQVLRDAVDPRHEVHVRQRLDAEEGGRRPGEPEDVGRRRQRAQDDQGQGHRQVSVARQLVAGRGRRLRLRAAARRVRRAVPRLLRQARVPDRRRPPGAPVHDDAASTEARGPGVDELDRG